MGCGFGVDHSGSICPILDATSEQIVSLIDEVTFRWTTECLQEAPSIHILLILKRDQIK